MTAIQEAELLAKKISETYKPEKIILFGSVAIGKEKQDSDIDLLIIKKSKKKRYYRIKEVFETLRGIKRNYPLDPIVYTPNEIRKRISLGDYFVKRILKEGKVLYG